MSRAEVSARYSDPVQSHLTVRSLDEDSGYKGMVFRAVKHLQHPTDEQLGVTDDEIWAYLEASTGSRFQRNVIARTRGLLILDGSLVQTADRLVGGHRRVACRAWSTSDTHQLRLFLLGADRG